MPGHLGTAQVMGAGHGPPPFPPAPPLWMLSSSSGTHITLPLPKVSPCQSLSCHVAPTCHNSQCTVWRRVPFSQLILNYSN